MLAETDRQASVDLNGFATRPAQAPTDMLWNVEFAHLADDLPKSAYTFNVLGTLCKTMCCGGKNSAFKKSWKFPKNMAEFQRFGADWITNAFIEAGHIDDSNRCISVECKPLSLQGLLSELIQIDVKFATEPDASVPSSFVVKFSPPSKQTLLIINLFKLGQTEFFNYKKLAPHFPCRIPRMWAGDMNFTSGRQCMVLDKIQAEFIAISEFDRITIKHVEKILDLLATVHATFWGDKLKKPGLAWLLNPDHSAFVPVYKIISKECNKHWDTWVGRVREPGFPVGGSTGFASMEVPQEVIAIRDLIIGFDPRPGNWKEYFAGPDCEWLSFMHGDARLDNFFFDDTVWESDEGLPGMIDLQLSQCSNVAVDVVYCLQCQSVYHRWPEEVDRLVQRYFDKLQSLGGAPNKQLAEFEEQLALAAPTKLLSAIIGTGSVDVEGALNPQQVLEVMHLLNTGCLLSMQRHGTVDVLKKMAAKTGRGDLSAGGSFEQEGHSGAAQRPGTQQKNISKMTPVEALALAKTVDPLKHRSGMYLRWDPDAPTALAALAKWREVLQTNASLPPIDAEGVPQQQTAMTEFDGGEYPWEESPKVVPRLGTQITAARLTNMLRGEGHLKANQSVKTADVKVLALQGLLSQVFKVEVTYENGTSDLPSSFIAKFLSPEPAFAMTRLIMGSAGISAFQLEDWMYNHNYIKKNGVRQPEFYFSSYDPVRESLCLLMEDMNDAGYSGGDQLSGGCGPDEQPHKEMFLEVMVVLASFHARTLNKGWKWEGHDLSLVVPAVDGPFISMMWPGITAQLLEHCPTVMAAAGVVAADDPLWKHVAYYVPNQIEYLYTPTTSLKEDGGTFNTAVVHGDARSENIFFPKSRKGVPAMIDFQLMRKSFPTQDILWFTAMSIPTEWRRANELELFNVHYDALIEKSKSDPTIYTWEQYLIEALAFTAMFFPTALLFLTSDMAAQLDPSAPGYDQRKRDVVAEMSTRCVNILRDFGVLDETPGRGMEGICKAVKTWSETKPWGPAQAEKACEEWVPAKWRNGRNPDFYSQYKMRKITDEEV